MGAGSAGRRKHGTWFGSIVGIAAGIGVEVVCALPAGGETVIVVTVVNKGEAR